MSDSEQTITVEVTVTLDRAKAEAWILDLYGDPGSEDPPPDDPAAMMAETLREVLTDAVDSAVQHIVEDCGGKVEVSVDA